MELEKNQSLGIEIVSGDLTTEKPPDKVTEEKKVSAGEFASSYSEILVESEKIATNKLDETNIGNLVATCGSTNTAEKSSNAFLDPVGSKENSSYQDSKASINFANRKATENVKKLNTRPKFDLKESLSRPLNYKPYTGKLPPLNR